MFNREEHPWEKDALTWIADYHRARSGLTSQSLNTHRR